MKDAKIYTVTELTHQLRSVLEDTFGDVWVQGEISNFIVASSGHAYFSLKDSGSLVNCVSFKSSLSKMSFTAEDGMKVICGGKISVYDKRGQYQLYVNKIEPLGKGALQLAFEQLKEKLYKEGLFEEEKKQTLPYLPMHIGIITSPTGAAVRDILNVAKRRFKNVTMTLCPVKVQGTEAKDEIVQAIKNFNEYNNILVPDEEKPVDVIILGRGGGSLEDLWPFNEECVARAIAGSDIPIVSAVGHEIDYTISDFVADLRAPTPSAAAEIVVPSKQEFIRAIAEEVERADIAIQTQIKHLDKELKSLSESYILRTPMNVFNQLEQQIDELLKSAETKVVHSAELKEKELALLEGKIKTLNPVSILDRGYSITLKNGKAVKDAKKLEKGDLIETKFNKGTAKSVVDLIDRE